MSLDIFINKANRKEWQDYSKGRKIDMYDSVTKDKPTTYIGEREGFPKLTPMGYFIGVKQFTMFDEVEDCVFTEFTKDMLKEVYNNIENDESIDLMYKTCLESWFTAVINTLNDDEIILVICDW